MRSSRFAFAIRLRISKVVDPTYKDVSYMSKSILDPSRLEGIEFSNDEIARYSRASHHA